MKWCAWSVVVSSGWAIGQLSRNMAAVEGWMSWSEAVFVVCVLSEVFLGVGG